MSDTLVQHSNNPHNRAIPVYDADLSTEQDSDVEELSHTVKQERKKLRVAMLAASVVLNNQSNCFNNVRSTGKLQFFFYWL